MPIIVQFATDELGRCHRLRRASHGRQAVVLRLGVGYVGILDTPRAVLDVRDRLGDWGDERVEGEDLPARGGCSSVR